MFDFLFNGGFMFILIIAGIAVFLNFVTAGAVDLGYRCRRQRWYFQFSWYAVPPRAGFSDRAAAYQSQ